MYVLRHNALYADVCMYCSRRLVYRSRQRGWLEVDLILGKWATEFVPTLTAEELIQCVVGCVTAGGWLVRRWRFAR